MQLLHFTVSEQTIYAKVPDRIIIEGTRQFVFAAFALDEEWAALTVYALFENDRRWGPPVKVLLTGDTIAVPPEVLVSGRLRVGLVGLGDGGAVRLTTKRMSAAIPVYLCGGTGGEDAEEMTPELWEQAIASIGPLGALETEDKSNLVAAINEARQTGGGGSGGTSDHSKLSNRDAADQHPIEAITGLEAALEGKQPAGSYLTEESDPTVPAWAKEEKKPSYTAQEVGADPSGTAAGLVAAHNTAEAAHNDIRLLISGLTQRLNALADSDDTTLDQLSEVVAYIKSNRELIASITTDKVSVADIIDNLTTNVANKPLSAAQGVALKALIDAISIPEKLPNPNALTFTGAATGSYDGSKPLTVNVPSLAVDDSLTKQGQAADAAKVGDALRSLSEEISNIPSGKDGADGITPTIGDNGNWYLGETDTGKPSRGEPGQDGADGKDGAPGAAGADGHTPVKGTDYFTAADKQEIAEAAAGMVSIPDKLPNPNALTFTGAVTGSYDGSAPLSVEIPSGGGGSSGGSGKAKSQILIDQEITELTASLSVTLEHDFHNLTAIINCSSAGAALTADSDGTAVASNIGLMIDTTSFGYNSRKVSQIDTNTTTWQTRMIGAEWSDDLAVFKRGFAVNVATTVANNSYNFNFGGTSAMNGTLGTDDNAPRTGKTANIVVYGAYLNVGTRVVLWGEYYE